MDEAPSSVRLGSRGRRVSDWYDREGADGRAVWIFLALFVVVWTLFQIIVFWSICKHQDVYEVFVWSRHPAAGYYKHPPLAALIAAAWFAIFPAADWSFDLLAALNAAVALGAVDLIARRYVAADRRLLVLLLLLLTPFYQFYGQRFNPNAVLLSTWPIATYCFLRAFERRSMAWSVAAGVAAALAMLAKYYSVYLVAGFLVAALSHPRRGDYLRSPAPWVSILSGLAVLAPHLVWLARSGPWPLRYALAGPVSGSIAERLTTTLAYIAGGVAYVALLLGVYLLAARPTRRLLAATFWPADPDRRLLVVLLAVPLLLPIATALISGVVVKALWTMPAWFLSPIILLAPAEISKTRLATTRIVLAAALMTAVIFAAPLVAWRDFLVESEGGHVFCRAASDELTRAWRAATGRRLAIVTGSSELSAAAAFYSPDHPDVAQDYVGAPSLISDDRRTRDGWAFVCFATRPQCLDRAEAMTAGHSGVTRVEKDVAASFFGLAPVGTKVVFFLIPPQR